ncbi:Na+/H+ antiporter subunit E [Nocardioides sp. GXZ039]|uniref:Na+/H+ antiporter subunit E n=1 Tax=Nocardioides sp. GXZ039 TaxID=3136018 RepID=UPI0030F43DF5
MNATRIKVRRATQRARRHVQWQMVLWLTLVWWVLWGTWSLMSLVGGALISTSLLLLFPLPPLDLAIRIRPWGVVVLVARFLWDVVVASLQVAAAVLRPRPDLRNAIVKVPLHTDSDLVLVLVAELVSLVPGTVVVEVRRSTSTLYLHVLDLTSPEQVEDVRRNVWAQEKRVLDALAPVALDDSAKEKGAGS